jgi:putative endonuclease
MFQVYVLQSESVDRLCIGSTSNVQKRVLAHNAGDVRSTKAYRPWKLLQFESFETKREARHREIQLKKSGRLRKELKQFKASKESGPLAAPSSNG